LPETLALAAATTGGGAGALDAFAASSRGVFLVCAVAQAKRDRQKDNRRIEPWLRKADVEVWALTWEVRGMRRMIHTILTVRYE
jgi:hypothetical protein